LTVRAASAYANSAPEPTDRSSLSRRRCPQRSPERSYTIFGQCDPASVELVKKIARMTRDPSNDLPFHPVKITHIEIQKAGARPAAPKLAAPNSTPGAKPSAATKKQPQAQQ